MTTVTIADQRSFLIQTGTEALRVPAVTKSARRCCLPAFVTMLTMSLMRRASVLIVVAALLAAGAAPAEARKRSKGRGRAAAPVPALTRDGWPNVMAAAAVVVDLDKGEEIYAKNPDDKRFIASVGKLFVALV